MGTKPDVTTLHNGVGFKAKPIAPNTKSLIVPNSSRRILDLSLTKMASLPTLHHHRTTMKNPVVVPSQSPVASQTTDDDDDGCCSMDYKTCVTYCGITKSECDSCETGESVVWLSYGPPSGQCTERWSGCDSNNVNNGCCDGLSCQWRDGYNYNACLPQPTIVTTPSPTVSPTTAAPQPVNVVDEDTCVDPEDKFTFMNKKATKVVATNKDCSWVAKKWKKRCGKLRLESDITKKPKHVCPLACGVCVPEDLECSPLSKKQCKQNAGCNYDKTNDTCINRN